MGATASILASPNERNSLLIQYAGNNIRSHLKVTLAGLQMIQEDNKDQNLHQLIHDTRIPCDKAIKLLTEMILMEQIHTDTLKLEIDTIKVRPFIETILKKMENEAKNKGIILLYDYYDVNEEVSIRADVDKLQLVLCNMISHAIQFTPEKFQILIKTSVISKPAPSKDWGIRFEVSDKGPGLIRVTSFFLFILLEIIISYLRRNTNSIFMKFFFPTVTIKGKPRDIPSSSTRRWWSFIKGKSAWCRRARGKEQPSTLIFLANDLLQRAVP